MNEFEIRIKIAKAALQQLQKSGNNAPEAKAAQRFLESYADAIGKIVKTKTDLGSKTRQLSKGNRTTYAKALESALCNAVQALKVSCEEQPEMLIGDKPKYLDLLAWKNGCERAVAIEVKSSANDFDNVASGLAEFFLARSTNAKIKSKGCESGFNATKIHFILICLYGSTDHKFFDLLAEKLFPRQLDRPELYSIFESNLKGLQKKKEASLKVAIQGKADALVERLCELFLTISERIHS
ncbi:MAG: hypothetical protein HZB40_17825 [Rhodocyclales bacterium]|nr:hypothetical protein [Rhodocyclales bacterium]